EGCGRVPTGALGAGAPALASDLDGFRRVLEGGRAGDLVSAGDPVGLAAALAALLADPGRRAALAVAGRERARRYAWPVVAASVLQVYEAAIAADPRRLVVRDPDG